MAKAKATPAVTDVDFTLEELIALLPADFDVIEAQGVHTILRRGQILSGSPTRKGAVVGLNTLLATTRDQLDAAREWAQTLPAPTAPTPPSLQIGLVALEACVDDEPYTIYVNPQFVTSVRPAIGGKSYVDVPNGCYRCYASPREINAKLRGE